MSGRGFRVIPDGVPGAGVPTDLLERPPVIAAVLDDDGGSVAVVVYVAVIEASHAAGRRLTYAEVRAGARIGRAFPPDVPPALVRRGLLDADGRIPFGSWGKL